MHNLILISRNYKPIFSILLILGLYGCWQKKWDYVYEFQMENATNDTLVVSFHHAYTHEAFDKININPNGKVEGEETRFGIIKTVEDENIVKSWLESREIIDTVFVYRNDSLKCFWAAPAYNGDTDDHNFFNYNSWNTWLKNDVEGVLSFTIYPEDLKLNNK